MPVEPAAWVERDPNRPGLQELCLRLIPSVRRESVVQWRLIVSSGCWCVFDGTDCVYDYGTADSIEEARLHAEGALFNLLEQLRMQLASRRVW